MSVLQKLRNALDASFAGDVLRRLHIARLGLRLHERLVLRRGQQTLVYNGRTLAFAVRDRRDITKVDTFLGMEGCMIDRILASARPGDTVFDVGANIGLLSVVVAASVPEIAVHSFEPNPDTACRARQNVVLNCCSNVTVHALALGHDNGVSRLYATEGDSGKDSMVPRAARRVASLTVQVERADDVARRLDLHPSIVKIDVEGAEMHVLLGMQHLLRGTVRDLFVEVHPRLLKEAGHDEDDLINWLESRGFRRVWSGPRGSETHQHFRRAGSRG